MLLSDYLDFQIFFFCLSLYFFNNRTTYQSTPLLALSLPLYVIDSKTHCCAVAKGGDEGD